VVVVAGADRVAGDDDRGVRRGHGRLGRGRGVPGVAAQAEADPGLEDHQGDRRCRVRAAPAGPRRAGVERAGRGLTRRPDGPPGERRGRHRLLREALRGRRDRARDEPRHAAQAGRRGGAASTGSTSRT
jgi:hypothetical protein